MSSINIYSEDLIPVFKEGGEILSTIRDEVLRAIRPGITTKELNHLAEKLMQKFSVVPAFKGYHNFPASICTSVNQTIVHGIPNNSKLQVGDVVSLDVGIRHRGFYFDSARTVEIDSNEHSELIKSGEEGFLAAFNSITAKSTTGDIGYHIHKEILKYKDENGEALLRPFWEFQGHGIGLELHEDPGIPNMGFLNNGIPLQIGMCICIEPVICYRSSKVLEVRGESVTEYLTSDRKPSSHYENQVYISNDGPILLT